MDKVQYQLSFIQSFNYIQQGSTIHRFSRNICLSPLRCTADCFVRSLNGRREKSNAFFLHVTFLTTVGCNLLRSHLSARAEVMTCPSEPVTSFDLSIGRVTPHEHFPRVVSLRSFPGLSVHLSLEGK